MKKLISICLVLLIVSCTGQTVNKESIQMRIHVTQDNHHFYDNKTVVTVNCMSDELTFNDTSSNFTLILDSNKEYMLTFNRPGCYTKSIFVSTVKMNKNLNFILDTKVNLLSTTNVDDGVLFGKLVYNCKTDSFEKSIVKRQ